MLKYIARRLALMIVVVLGVTIMTFSIMHLAPGDPAEMIALARYGEDNLTQEDIEKIRIAEGLDAPIHIQYMRWLKHVIKGDFGASLITGDLVQEEILIRFPTTLKLALAAKPLSGDSILRYNP